MEQKKLRTLLSDGLYFEGPRWHNGSLWLVDSLSRTILTIGPGGDCKRICEIDGIAGGMGFLPTGEPVVTSMFARALLRYSRGQLAPIADLSRIAAGTIDDMIIDGEGRIYVGDLGVDLMNPNRVANDAVGRGGLILVTPDGKARAVAEGLRFPNGIAISGDGRTLIVAETDGDSLARFRIRSDGSLDFETRFGNFAEPDGICMDREGSVWVSLFKEDAFVRVDSDGRVLDRIPVPGRRAVACALGGADRRTLFCVSAETTHEDLFRGKSLAWVHATEVEIAGAGYP